MGKIVPTADSPYRGDQIATQAQRFGQQAATTRVGANNARLDDAVWAASTKPRISLTSLAGSAVPPLRLAFSPATPRRRGPALTGRVQCRHFCGLLGCDRRATPPSP